MTAARPCATNSCHSTPQGRNLYCEWCRAQQSRASADRAIAIAKAQDGLNITITGIDPAASLALAKEMSWTYREQIPPRRSWWRRALRVIAFGWSA